MPSAQYCGETLEIFETLFYQNIRKQKAEKVEAIQKKNHYMRPPNIPESSNQYNQ